MRTNAQIGATLETVPRSDCGTVQVQFFKLVGTSQVHRKWMTLTLVPRLTPEEAR
jgi:hypothetical protein